MITKNGIVKIEPMHGICIIGFNFEGVDSINDGVIEALKWAREQLTESIKVWDGSYVAASPPPTLDSVREDLLTLSWEDQRKVYVFLNNLKHRI